MNDLFGNTPYQQGSATSRESAERMDETGAAEEQLTAIMDYMESRGLSGATVDEATIFLKQNGFPHVHNGTVAGQFVRLEKLFKIKKTARTRKSSADRNVTVYALHDGTPIEAPKTDRERNRETIETAANFLNGLVAGKQLPGAAYVQRAREIEADLRAMLKGAKP